MIPPTGRVLRVIEYVPAAQCDIAAAAGVSHAAIGYRLDYHELATAHAGTRSKRWTSRCKGRSERLEITFDGRLSPATR